MTWGIFRVAVFGTAFLIGCVIAGTSGTTVFAPALESSGMPGPAGSSLVVACDEGGVSVDRIEGTGAIELRCDRGIAPAVVAPEEPGKHRMPSTVERAKSYIAIMILGKLNRIS